MFDVDFIVIKTEEKLICYVGCYVSGTNYADTFDIVIAPNYDKTRWLIIANVN